MYANAEGGNDPMACWRSSEECIWAFFSPALCQWVLSLSCLPMSRHALADYRCIRPWAETNVQSKQSSRLKSRQPVGKAFFQREVVDIERCFPMRVNRFLSMGQVDSRHCATAQVAWLGAQGEVYGIVVICSDGPWCGMTWF